MKKQRGVIDPITLSFIVVAIIAVLGLSGCATTQTDMKRANALCANNGGVAKINPKYNDTVSIVCSNSAKFKFSSTGN